MPWQRSGWPSSIWLVSVCLASCRSPSTQRCAPGKLVAIDLEAPSEPSSSARAARHHLMKPHKMQQPCQIPRVATSSSKAISILRKMPAPPFTNTPQKRPIRHNARVGVETVERRLSATATRRSGFSRTENWEQHWTNAFPNGSQHASEGLQLEG